MKKFLILIAVIVSMQLLYAEDPLFEIDQPVFYGEEEFIRRIEARTRGEREPVGLVLSGGSARAFAHIGVLEYLEEVGVVPDFIIANSMGSIVGMLYGAGLSPSQMYDLMLIGLESPLFSLDIPLTGGVLNTDTFMSLIAKVVGEDLDMEELPVPVLVVTEDLRTKRQVRIASGDFLTVLKASFALPFYFSPVAFGDHLLIDGGFTNLVPVGVGKDYSDQVIVATTFYQNPDLNLSNPLTILNVAVDISKARKGIEELKALDHILIRSDVETFSFMAFDRIDELKAAGYASAQSQFDPAEHGLGSPEQVLSDEEDSLRRDYCSRIAEIPLSISSRGYLPVTGTRFSLSPFFTAGAYPLDRRYLQEGMRFGLVAEGRSGGMIASLYGGGRYTPGEGGFSPLAGGEIHGFLGRRASFTSGIQYDLPSSGYAFLFGDAGHQFAPWIALRGGSGIEARWDKEGSDDMLLTSWIGLSGSPLMQLQYALEGGHQLNREQQQVFFGDGELSWNFRALEVSPRLIYKRAMSGAPVVFYPREGLHLQPDTGPSQGWVSLLDLTAHLDGIRPTFAEMIMVRGVQAGVFAEAGVVDSLIWSAGIRLGTKVSLIGLEELALQLTVGYDSVSSAVRSVITIQM